MYTTYTHISSTVGSPNSNHGQLAFFPEYQHTGLGVNPGIVDPSNYFSGTEYSTYPPGMEEFNMTFVDNKAIGELARVSFSIISHLSLTAALLALGE